MSLSNRILIINLILNTTMKKLIYTLGIMILLVSLSSCETDNYSAPDATVSGKILDHENNPMQLEQGGTGMVIRMFEEGFTTPTPFDLNVMQDGTYINNKIFAAKYKMIPAFGPFYNLSDTITVDIKGFVTVDFKVTPYLKVEWVTPPYATADGKIETKFKFTRIQPPAESNQKMPNLLDYQLFIGLTQYVGNNNFDNLVVNPAVSATNAMEGQTLTITSKTAMRFSRDYYVRVGVRVNDANKKYNYTDIKVVSVKLP